MSKINKKLIILSLAILAILAFALISLPTNASAEGGSNYVYGNNYPYVQNYPQPVYVPYPTPVYYPTPVPAPTPAPTPTQTIYSNSTNPNPNQVRTRIVYRTVPSTSTNNTNNTPPPAPATYGNNSNDTANNLAANALYGSNSFLPSGIIQWLLFAIFILILIIVARRMFGHRENFLAAPLKHE